jgi:hypothetical protein
MKKTMQRLGLALVGFLAILGITLGSTAPASADGTGHSLKITHKSNDTNDTLIVCKDWTSSSSVTSSCSSKFASLAPGKNTVDELGWSDTDGARIPKGRALKVSVYGPDYTAYRNCTGGTKWKKLSPYVYGGTANYILYLVDANC